jgi:hypothetical protein
MKYRINLGLAVATPFALMLAIGCAAKSETSAPEVSTNGIDEEASISDNGWTSTANAPSYAQNQLMYEVRGSATFTRQSGVTSRPAGVCLVQPKGQSCNVVGDCGSAPPGGFMYCAQIDGSGTKQCLVRPGSQAAYCAGTPVTGSPLTPSTVTTPAILVPSGTVQSWISYACFAACSATDPSVSSSASVYYVPPPCGGEPVCGSVCC